MNSWQRILVHLDGSPRSAVRLRLARRIAQPKGAHVFAMMAVTPVWQSIPLTTFGDGGSAALLQEAQADRRRAALDLVEQERAKPGAPLHWLEVGEVRPASDFAHHALCSDLTVLGQHDPDDPLAWGTPPDLVPQVLAVSGRPGLVVPWAGDFEDAGQRVVIAWKPSRASAAAVSAALPVLRTASEVTLLSWTEPAEAARSGPDLTRALAAWLDAHGVRARIEFEGAPGTDLGDLLLSATADRGADLLVMGCYGHSRMREWMFGGVTRTVLRSMTLPVLMAH